VRGGVVTAPPAALEVSDVAFAYADGHQVLFGVSFDVAPGERVAVLGPNGAGKTTLALHLNGVLGPTAGGAAAGRVRVSGVDVEPRTLPEVRRRVGIVFQDPDDQLFMPTVQDDVAFGPYQLGLRGTELRERVAEALDAVGMRGSAGRPPHHLSFGQRRRVAVAGVLAMRPDVLVLDEPTSNLDPTARRELAEVVTALDVAVLVITHDLPFALQLCPRSLVLDAGRLVADGPTRELLADGAFMSAHRLELPYGFDPLSVAGA
jgi:cobalt/nickel transport system ATP-binding protein